MAIALIKPATAQSAALPHATIAERKGTSAASATLHRRKNPVTAAVKLDISRASVPIQVLGEAEAAWVVAVSLQEEGVVSFMNDDNVSPILTGTGKAKNATSVARLDVSVALWYHEPPGDY